MSDLVTLLTRRAPTIHGLEFDAVLEDSLYLSAMTTGYPIESGANAADHIIINPAEVVMTVAISNNPLKASVTDFLGGFLSNYVGQSTFAAISGLSAGFLAGSDNSRAALALQTLFLIMVAREPFDLELTEGTFSNMVIIDIERTRTPENENGVEARVTMQEYPTIETFYSKWSTKQTQLNPNDSSRFQVAEWIDRGEQSVANAGAKFRGLF
jgi:hypothetical protein